MVILQMIDVLSEGVDPLDELIGFVVGVKNLMNSRLIQVDALLDDVNFGEGLEMGGFYLLDEFRPFLIALNTFDLLLVLILWVFV